MILKLLSKISYVYVHPFVVQFTHLSRWAAYQFSNLDNTDKDWIWQQLDDVGSFVVRQAESIVIIQ